MDYSLPGAATHGILQARILQARGLPFPSLGDLPDPGIKLRSPALQADSLLTEPANLFCSIEATLGGLLNDSQMSTSHQKAQTMIKSC